MGAGHAQLIYRPGDTPVHRLPPQCKLVAALGFVLIVVATPREHFWAFGAYAAMLAALLTLARLPPAFTLRRMLIEVPFLGFALLLPFLSRGERVWVAGIPLVVEGLLGSWNIVAKGTLGVVTSIVLAATTEPSDLLSGARRLRLPQTLVQIATFMLRYVDVILDEMRRMRIAREARGFHQRGLRQWPALARTAATLFIRSYERGERVYLAMISRGYAGTMPVFREAGATGSQWAVAVAFPSVSLAVAVAAVTW